MMDDAACGILRMVIIRVVGVLRMRLFVCNVFLFFGLVTLIFCTSNLKYSIMTDALFLFLPYNKMPETKTI